MKEFVITVVLVIILFLGVSFFVMYLDGRSDPARYAAWTKLHQDTGLAYDEWKLLKDAHLLGNAKPPK